MFNLKRIICFIFGHKNWYETNDPDIESGCFYCGYSTLKRKPKEFKRVYKLNHFYSLGRFNKEWTKFKATFSNPRFISEYKIKGNKCYVRFTHKEGLKEKIMNLFKRKIYENL